MRLKKGISASEIALRLGVHRSTITRELKRNGEVSDISFWKQMALDIGSQGLWDHVKNKADKEHSWTAENAQRVRNARVFYANQVRRRKKVRTVEWIKSKLVLGWSPGQIAGRSKIDGPETVSHECIYQLIYQQKKRGKDLHRYLKRYRKRKQRFNPRQYHSRIPNRVGIEDRPKIVDKRTRIGDLEGDLIVGYKSYSYLLTVVDRVSRKVFLKKLQRKTKMDVLKGLKHAVKFFGVSHTLTLDNGTEFCAHTELTEATGISVYFTHPFTSQEKGTIENTNGLVRYYLPKSTDLQMLPDQDIRQIQQLLNTRPREILDFLTPNEAHRKHLSNHSMNPSPCCI
jgi:IS30 family transposase